MKFSSAAFIRLTMALSAGLLLAPDSLRAQAGNVWKAKLVMEMQQTPEFSFSGAKKKRTDALEWLEVEVAFVPEVKERQQGPPFIDNVEVRYFILLQGGERGQILTHTVTHRNVPLNTTCYSSAYIPPVVLARQVAKAKATLADVRAVAVEIHHGGDMVGFDQKGFQRDGQWREGDQVQDLIRSINKTPFALLYPDRYPEVTD
ncbi:MAG TPA: Amuc_1102 family pilus-like protein [Verrucomicrobiales bacterium]|nr:Amuc_1102 family pilus-like protein [Verrucomicrobiales bacterium]